tara:strand:+ start:912 stop:1565 length:654 start_codon:yes stop_codon:yes gene_type:complete
MIKKNIDKILREIPEHVQLVAISKTRSNQEILDAYNSGQISFGENKIQEMTKKFEDLPKNIDWHMVGHVQSNKIKYMAPFVNLIHGIDSFKAIKIINKEGEKNNRLIKCLLQLKISNETSKFGLDAEGLKEIIFSDEYKSMNYVKIIGIMSMASNTSKNELIKNEFLYARKIFEEIKKFDEKFSVLSMGMSNDYKLAIDCGSNMIRVGSLIFGSRNY